jgi:predicted N-acetyltransferase YhbS
MADLDIIISSERPQDEPAIQGLEERAFGPGRYARTAFRLRENNPHDPDLSFVARVSTLVVGSIRLSHIRIGAAPALLLGPLTVDPAFRSRGLGRRLIDAALQAARAHDHQVVLLVGDEAYYGRMGFKRANPAKVMLPGPVDPMRVLVLGLAEGALEAASGRVMAGSGVPEGRYP